MSDYEATAYLSLEKLKVRRVLLKYILGETYARISTVLRQDKEGAES